MTVVFSVHYNFKHGQMLNCMLLNCFISSWFFRQSSGHSYWTGFGRWPLAWLCHSSWSNLPWWVCPISPPPGEKKYSVAGLYLDICLTLVHSFGHFCLFNYFFLSFWLCWRDSLPQNKKNLSFTLPHVFSNLYETRKKILWRMLVNKQLTVVIDFHSIFFNIATFSKNS